MFVQGARLIELRRLLPSIGEIKTRLIDNHTLGNVAFALHEKDSPGYQNIRKNLVNSLPSNDMLTFGLA